MARARTTAGQEAQVEGPMTVDAGNDTGEVTAVQTITNESNSKASSKAALTERLPKGIDICQVVYVRLDKSAQPYADRVKAITIRETNVGIVLQSGREINAAEIGKMIFLKEKDVK